MGWEGGWVGRLSGGISGSEFVANLVLLLNSYCCDMEI